MMSLVNALKRAYRAATETGKDRNETIDFVFRTVVSREPTESERAYWKRALRKGTRPAAMGKELSAHTGATDTEGLDRAIRLAFQTTLLRDPSPDEITARRAWMREGASFWSLFSELIRSHEASLTWGIEEAETDPSDDPAEQAPDDGQDLPDLSHAARQAAFALHARRQELANWDACVTHAFKALLHRNPARSELEQRRATFDTGSSFISLLQEVEGSEEAAAARRIDSFVSDMPVGWFIMWLYEACLMRGASAEEIDHWREALVTERISRTELLDHLFGRYLETRVGQEQAPAKHESGACLIMGTGEIVDRSQWLELVEQSRESQPESRERGTQSRFQLKPGPAPRVSIITSLYGGGDYISRFLDNITAQSIFDDCELIIIDANSPEGEHETIRRYQERFPQIRYERLPYRAGIYSAWNLGVQMARGTYLTNANLDDLRRTDSLELQAATLDNIPFADVVYQEVLYTFDGELSFEAVEAVGLQTRLPIVTPHNLIKFNSPHNAPMWRKSLHDDVGLFDDRLKSAGDWEFWVRCLRAGKAFYKTNEPHVVYFQNPEGISTRPDTPGVEEAMWISRRHWIHLLPTAFLEDEDDFLARCREICHSEVRKLGGPRYDHVQAQLRQLASEHEARTPLPPDASAGGDIHLIVDGVAFQGASSDIQRLWRGLLPALAGAMRVSVLDRGGVPPLDGIERIPFPAYTGTDTAADSALIEKICRYYEADIFTSTGYTTPMQTPMVVIAHDTFTNSARLPGSGRTWREQEVAICYARRRVCVLDAVSQALHRALPFLSDETVSVVACGTSPSDFVPRPAEETDRFRARYGLKGDYFVSVDPTPPEEGSVRLSVLVAGGPNAAHNPTGGTIPDVIAEGASGWKARQIVVEERDLPAAFTGACGLLHASKSAGPGFPVLDAMACGCPVILPGRSPFAGLAGEAAVVLEGETPTALIAAMERLRKPATRATLGEKAVGRSKSVSSTTLADHMIQQIRTVLRERDAGIDRQFHESWSRMRSLQADVDY